MHYKWTLHCRTSEQVKHLWFTEFFFNRKKIRKIRKILRMEKIRKIRILDLCSQMSHNLCRSFLRVSLQCVLGRAGPLLNLRTFQYITCCVMCWWSICITWPSQYRLLSLSLFYVLAVQCLSWLHHLLPNQHLTCFFAICDEQLPVSSLPHS